MKTIQLGLICVALCLSTFSRANSVQVYAAASLGPALTDVIRHYQLQHPEAKIVPVFGTSSTLAKHIVRGAKVDLYFPADQDWMTYLVKRNKVKASQVKPIIYNQLVAIALKDARIPFRAHPTFNFPQAFTGRLCTGQVDSVAVGKYAKHSLTKLGWYKRLEKRIIGASDARAALAFVERGACQVGIVYRSDAVSSDKVKVLGAFPVQTHPDIVYTAALTKQGEKNRQAVKFRRYLGSAAAHKIFVQHGFRP
ncbi:MULTISPECIES: molybdate ABC transporter substrate-binding protein [Acinetobacter]|uniref:molybdate ABC transporter substrate-binding protein n=1 Tax=Acinetobacter TaxID=469 RepID=UPI0015D3063A|nr:MULTISPECIES: molybdate ABC transporter substrate-binding protein [Acinetobacter]MDM1275602.1 molybdate ABC transporter substrate-binding protein [Acinetobacter indicus]MDM1301704.1 molybdate ABC transporter substrate-binding protein [Acinetobacter indicus]MDM1304631.1 molybdate ABC transporter substrate-binding protein [Acinetobacter indicus]MDM1770958.1 molybdate ABC transporter substrate-binding protein [Acinetobacter indicus]MDM1773850.1 molybdate ABC transporter substrate-binding prote